jgi:hypothetical protein
MPFRGRTFSGHEHTLMDATGRYRLTGRVYGGQ